MTSLPVWTTSIAVALRGRYPRLGERGASLIEYGLLVGLIALVCILAVAFLGTSTSARYSATGSALS